MSFDKKSCLLKFAQTSRALWSISNYSINVGGKLYRSAFCNACMTTVLSGIPSTVCMVVGAYLVICVFTTLFDNILILDCA